MTSELTKNPTNPLSFVEVLLSVIFLCLTWPALIIRFYVRGRLIRNLGADDFLMAVALVRPQEGSFERV